MGILIDIDDLIRQRRGECSSLPVRQMKEEASREL